jgi:hypothetical protein
MVWGFCYLRIFKKLHSISGRGLPINESKTAFIMTIFSCHYVTSIMCLNKNNLKKLH